MIILIFKYKISISINVLIFLIIIFICLNVYFWFWLDFILVIEKLIQDGGRAVRPEHPLRLNFKPNWGRIQAITCKNIPKFVNNMVNSIKNFFREHLSLTSIRLTAGGIGGERWCRIEDYGVSDSSTQGHPGLLLRESVEGQWKTSMWIAFLF